MALEIRGKLSPRTDLTYGLAGLAALLLAWCLLTYGGYVKPLFLPTPTAVWEGMESFVRKGWLDKALIYSTLRVLKALAITVLIAVPIGVLMGAFAPVDAFLRKIVNAGKAVPPTAIIGLVVLWFGIEEKAKIVFLFMGAVFYMIVLVKDAVANVREEYLRVATDLGMSPFMTVRKVLIPGALPQIWNAITVSSGIMWTYIILAEFINSNQEQIGLGYLLLIGTRTQESGMVYAALILIVLVSTTFDWLMNLIRRRYFNW